MFKFKGKTVLIFQRARIKFVNVEYKNLSLHDICVVNFYELKQDLKNCD